MKKLYTTLVAILIASHSFAQWTNGTNITNTNTGNVGIGTTNPNYKLDVSGVINTNYYMSNAMGVYVDGNTNTGINNSSGSLSFRTNGLDNRMIINLIGNVGVGTTNPRAKFDITADVATGNVITMQAWNWTQDPTQWGLRVDEYHTGTAIDQRFIQNVGGTDANVMTFHAGFVGIGTTTPKEALSVNGKVRAKEIKVETANWPDYVHVR
jgi:hypothetical protein